MLEKPQDVKVPTYSDDETDYASDRTVPIEVPAEKHVEHIVDVGTGTIAATDNGTEYDLGAAGTVDQTATTYKARNR